MIVLLDIDGYEESAVDWELPPGDPPETMMIGDFVYELQAVDYDGDIIYQRAAS